ncbi:MAG: hypothetical protein A4S09_12360 [Proteobacteria bacterium SG_bin7]|nr:MAG: hypothetical protein A4S09_12360 [Proteobacteria bacterium SG_bin7]
MYFYYFLKDLNSSVWVCNYSVFTNLVLQVSKLLTLFLIKPSKVKPLGTAFAVTILKKGGIKMSQNKVVNFPIHKVKSKVMPDYSSSPLNIEQKRILISALLVSVFLVVTILNTSEPTQSRSIASVSERMPNSLSTSFEKSVIAKYTNNLAQPVAHLGTRPSKIEGLAFGTLNGSYLVSLDSGKITRIKVAERSTTNYNPQKIKSANSFLEQYKNLLAVEFKSANKTHEKLTSEVKLEEFDLINSDQQRVGIATFTFDKAGYFISLQIEKSQSVAAN